MLFLHKFPTNAKQYLYFWLVKLFHMHLHCSILDLLNYMQLAFIISSMYLGIAVRI